MPRQRQVDLIPGNTDKIAQHFVVRIEIAGAAEIARVLAVAAAIVFGKMLDDEHTGTALPGGERRARASIAAADHDDVVVFRTQVLAPKRYSAAIFQTLHGFPVGQCATFRVARTL